MISIIEFVRRREALRLKKAEGGPPPWSTDEILNTYRFTNVRRRDDRVSQWLLNNVLNKYGNVNDPSFVKFVALSRWINWPPTIRAIMEEGFWPKQRTDYKKVGRFLHSLKRKGGKVWTGAYMVFPGSNKTGSKGYQIAVNRIDKPLSKVMRELLSNSKKGLKECTWETLCGCPGWGDFMAGQVVDDLSWTPLLRAGDNNTWAPQGPGSVRGFNRLLGRPIKQKVHREEWLPQLQIWRRELIYYLGPSFADLTLMDTQNVLCEISKYAKVEEGSGRPRAKYKPETRF